jgi:hypothetical protein
MRRSASAGLLLFATCLSGCLSNKGSDMAECKQNEGGRIRQCMESRGYSFGPAKGCSGSVEDVRCYIIH